MIAIIVIWIADVQNSNNIKDEEKVEIFSLSSTSERKPKIRRRLIQKQKRGNKINEKKNKSQSKYIDIYENSKNESENDDKQKKQEEFIEIDITPNLDSKQDNDDNNNDDNDNDDYNDNSEKSNVNNSSKEESESEEENDNSNDIRLERDLNYLSYNSEYIKYDPLKTYFIDKNINNKSDENKSLPILEIPRIRQRNPIDAIKIREKDNKYNIIIDDVDQKEISYYKGRKKRCSCIYAMLRW